MKVKIERLNVLEGPLYEVIGGDGPLHVFDSEVVAITADGRTWGRDYFVIGYAIDDDNLYVPNTNYKNDCLELMKSVNESWQEIDTDMGWYEIPADRTSLEERMEHEAMRESQEREGLPVEQPLPVPPTEAPYLRSKDVQALALEERLLMGGGLSDSERNFLSHYNE